MVKHGQEKHHGLGRAGTHNYKLETTHATNNITHWNLASSAEPNISDPVTRVLLDPAHCPKAHLAELTAKLNPSSSPPIVTAAAAAASKVVDDDVDHVASSSCCCSKPKNSDTVPPEHCEQLPLAPCLNHEEQVYILECMRRYGTNYAAAFRDITTNYFQYTEDQLSRMGEQFLLLTPDEIVIQVDTIPKQIRALMVNFPPE
jgi:hypothetical protein